MVYADHATYPAIADVTGDFVYARLQTGSDDVETAYPPAELDAWTARLKTWAEGGRPADLPCVDPAHTPDRPTPRRLRLHHPRGQDQAPAGRWRSSVWASSERP